jgi:hypothetical protein
MKPACRAQQQQQWQQQTVLAAEATALAGEQHKT